MLLPILITFLPLIGALFAIIQNNKLVAQFLSSILVTISSILSWCLFLKCSYPSNISNIISWIHVGSFQANWSIQVDSLTSLMFIVITTVSSVVHFYSIGYMNGDPHIRRFFAYISLFTFCMLILVSSSDFIQLFFGWEGVGLCSYLLIGFWFKKKSANVAAMKAFIVNRIGDFSLILSIALIYCLFDSVKFIDVFANASIYQEHHIYGFNTLTIITLLLFVGCMGKSAQIGFHTWLPDAMEGPTPVSALIHAATMVTAGIFLLVRCSTLFELTELTKDVIVIIGGITCFVAATIAMTQQDIKKIIAYSTCSQLGYMFIACGLSAYGIAMFHLATHAFFKALLFLCAGNVIHSMSGEQDIKKMSPQLWKEIPITYVVMWIGSLAIAGIFPFAGFYSKDLILEVANGHNFAFTIGMIVVIFTAFYSWRLIINVFHNNKSSYVIVHESPKIMLIPLFLLAFFSITGGFLGEYFFHITDISFWHNSIEVIEMQHVDLLDKNLPIVFSVSGILMAYLLRGDVLGNSLTKSTQLIAVICLGVFLNVLLFKNKISYLILSLIICLLLFKWKKFVHCIVNNKYYFDQMYDFLFIKGIKSSSVKLWKYFDIKLIDQFMVNGVALTTQKVAQRVVNLQTGFIFDYALSIILSIVVLLAIFMFFL